MAENNQCGVILRHGASVRRLNIFSKIFANLPNNSLTPQNHAEKSDMFTYLYGVCKLFTDIRCKLSKTEIKDRWSFSAIEKIT